MLADSKIQRRAVRLNLRFQQIAADGTAETVLKTIPEFLDYMIETALGLCVVLLYMPPLAPLLSNSRSSSPRSCAVVSKEVSITKSARSFTG